MTARARLSGWLQDGELPERPKVLRWAAMFARLLVLAAQRFHRDRGQEKAASLAYATLLSLIPFLVLAASLIEFLDPEQHTHIVEWFTRAVFPSEAAEVREGIKEYVERSSTAFHADEGTSTGLRIFGAAMLVWFAASLITGVDRVVGDIWGTGSIRAFVRRLAAYWAVITLGPLLLALSIVGSTLLERYAGPSIGGTVARGLPFVVTWLSAFAFFRLMPHTGARTGAALAGAVIAGTLWEGTKILMGWYLATPKTLLTALSFFPAALLWMYLSWAIAIYGLEITYVVHHGSWRPGRRAGSRDVAPRARDELVLGVAIEIARAFDAALPAPDRARIAEVLGVAEDQVMTAILALQAAGVITADEEGGFRPARGAAGIRVVELVDASRGRGGAATLPSAAQDFLATLERDGRDAVADVRLADLLRAEQISG